MLDTSLDLIKGTLLLALFALLCGCSSVHTDAENSPLVAMWLGSNPEQHRLVRDVLQDHGVQASLDDKGVVVKKEDSRRASKILLTDQRLEPSGLMLMVMAQAGTGRATDNGFVATLVMPSTESGVDVETDTLNDE